MRGEAEGMARRERLYAESELRHELHGFYNLWNFCQKLPARRQPDGTVSDYASLGSGPTGGVDTNAPSFQRNPVHLGVQGGANSLLTLLKSRQRSRRRHELVHTVTITLMHTTLPMRLGSGPIRCKNMPIVPRSTRFKVEVLASAISVPPFRITTSRPWRLPLKLTWNQ